eukprot:364420-Chlamydomonas_euryale.AAC.4
MRSFSGRRPVTGRPRPPTGTQVLASYTCVGGGQHRRGRSAHVGGLATAVAIQLAAVCCSWDLQLGLLADQVGSLQLFCELLQNACEAAEAARARRACTCSRRGRMARPRVAQAPARPGLMPGQPQAPARPELMPGQP